MCTHFHIQVQKMHINVNMNTVHSTCVDFLCIHIYSFIIPQLCFCVLQLFLLLCLPLAATYSPHAFREGRTSLILFSSFALPTSSFLCFVTCQGFPRGVFLVLFCFFRDFAPAWVRNCFCCGAAKLFETLYMISVCTNKLILTCLQLHHSYKARMCLNQSGSLVHCQSAQVVTFPWFAVICSFLCLLKRSPGIYHEVLIAM